MTDTRAQATAEIATPHASKYLQQLCKHFAHKIPSTFDAERGSLSFSSGEVQLAAGAEALTIALDSPTPEELERLEDVVARHLVRFAFREELAIAWA